MLYGMGTVSRARLEKVLQVCSFSFLSSGGNWWFSRLYVTKSS
jgi:hypothetical protein